jgi:hypothetical protein
MIRSTSNINYADIEGDIFVENKLNLGCDFQTLSIKTDDRIDDILFEKSFLILSDQHNSQSSIVHSQNTCITKIVSSSFLSTDKCVFEEEDLDLFLENMLIDETQIKIPSGKELNNKYLKNKIEASGITVNAILFERNKKDIECELLLLLQLFSTKYIFQFENKITITRPNCFLVKRPKRPSPCKVLSNIDCESVSNVGKGTFGFALLMKAQFNEGSNKAKSDLRVFKVDANKISVEWEAFMSILVKLPFF